MNNKGQLAAYEAAIIISLLAYSIFITYKWATKPNEAKIFHDKSSDRTVSPQAHFGCVNLKVEQFLESKNALINSVAK